MTVATALVTGNDPQPHLAEEAVLKALAKAGLTHANGVLLFLTHEFSRHAQATVTAAARAAQSMQVAGGLASGVLTESGWTLDRPAVAAMVLGGELSLGVDSMENYPLLSYSGGAFPPEWENSGSHFGGMFGGSYSGTAAHAEPAVWQQSRLTVQQRCSVQILGAECTVGVSTGLRLLGKPLEIECCKGFDLERLGGQTALNSLTRLLPPGFREQLAQHIHHLAAVLLDKTIVSGCDLVLASQAQRPVALIAINADNSVTLAERIEPGQSLVWAIRQPITAEADMRQTLERMPIQTPACALMFSCIGRGPFFYGGEDRDLAILCERFPGLPVLGVYGTGQIAPATRLSGNREIQNSVVTALISKQHGKDPIQPIR